MYSRGVQAVLNGNKRLASRCLEIILFIESVPRLHFWQKTSLDVYPLAAGERPEVSTSEHTGRVSISLINTWLFQSGILWLHV